VFAFISRKINGAEAQGDAQAIALEMVGVQKGPFSFFFLRVAAGRELAPDDKSLKP